jgi:hypothetical protein
MNYISPLTFVLKNSLGIKSTFFLLYNLSSKHCCSHNIKSTAHEVRADPLELLKETQVHPHLLSFVSFYSDYDMLTCVNNFPRHQIS